MTTQATLRGRPNLAMPNHLLGYRPTSWLKGMGPCTRVTHRRAHTEHSCTQHMSTCAHGRTHMRVCAQTRTHRVYACTHEARALAPGSEAEGHAHKHAQTRTNRVYARSACTRTGLRGTYSSVASSARSPAAMSTWEEGGHCYGLMPQVVHNYG